MQNKASLKWIYKNSKHFLITLIILTVLGSLISIVNVKFAVASRDLIDVWTNQISGNKTEKFIYLSILVVLQLLIQVSYASLSVRVSGKLSIKLKKQLFNLLLKKDYKSISDFHSGDILNRINSDIGVITKGITSIIPNVISFLTRIIYSFVVLYSFDPILALIFLTVGPLILVVARIYSNKMKTLHKKCQQSDGKVRSFMLESLQNLLVIKSFKNEDIITDQSTDLQRINYDYKIKRNHISIIANIMFYIAITVGYYFALAWCAYKISIGLMTFGTLLGILQLVGQIQVPFKDLSGILPQYYSTVASVERIMEIEELPNEKGYNNNDIDAKKLYKDMRSIDFNNVTFTYDKEVIFNNADFSIEKGDFIAIAGISGIGKSTLLKLLLGIIMPQAGQINISNNNNQKVMLDKYCRGLFAYVPQGNMILSGSIRENIAFSALYNNDGDIIKAAKVARIWDDINALPNKLDTKLGEKGLGLSEGQVQRIAIARAIYYDAPIILLDEATSALDEETERAVLNNLKKLQTKTCIIVSHKKASLDVCNKKINIRNGKIILKQ